MQNSTYRTNIYLHNDALTWQPTQGEDGWIQNLPEEAGVGQNRLFHLAEDFNVIETRLQPDRALTIANRIDDRKPRMVLTLGLEGASRFNSNLGGEAVFREGYGTVTTFHGGEGCRHYQAKQAVNQLRFSVGLTWLEQQFGDGAFGDLFKKRRMQMVSHRPLSASALVAARTLQANRLAAATMPLFRYGQSIAILAVEISHLLEHNGNRPRLTPKDKQIAYSARDILFEEYADPPSVTNLCKRLATNANKLKLVFRHYFDTTPYGMLLDIRMAKAYEMLQTRGYSVAIVAEAVGYSHANNFSAAFAKYYGFSPLRSKNAFNYQP